MVVRFVKNHSTFIDGLERVLLPTLARSSKLGVVVPGRIYQGSKSHHQSSSGMRLKVSPHQSTTESRISSSNIIDFDSDDHISKNNSRSKNNSSSCSNSPSNSRSKYKTMFASASMVQEVFMISTEGQLTSASDLASHLRELIELSGAKVRVEAYSDKGKENDDQEDNSDNIKFSGQKSVAEKALNKKFYF